MNVYIGKSITSFNDALIKMPLKELVQRIRNPKTEFVDRIKQLRITLSIDKNRYKELKKTLPYFTCGNFHPSIRKKENFASIACFVIDIDHLSENELLISELKEKLKVDSHVLAFFVSPSDDGLKVIFSFSEPVKDAALFQAFYKIFSIQFAQKHQIENCVDYKTSDVSRACFISYDQEAYFNENAEMLLIDDFLKVHDFEASEIQIKEAEKFAKAIDATRTQEEKNTVVSEDVLARIKQKLSPSSKPIISKTIFLPPEIDEFIPLLEKQLIDFEIDLIEKTPIHYGRKLRFKAGIHWAEINLFYGKKGYSIVKTPKTGSNANLAESCYQIIQHVLNSKIHE